MKKIYGTYPWFEEYGHEKIHPEDREIFMRETSNVKVYEFTRGDKNYNYFRYGENEFRIADTLKIVLREPKFSFKEEVFIEKEGTKGYVKDIMWHYQKSEFYYYLGVSGKNKSNRYFEKELNKYQYI